MTNWLSHPDVYGAAQLLRQHAVIAYPTEAVWGLGCSPWSELAVEKILHLKQRPVEKGLILLASCFTQLEPFLRGLDSALIARIQAPCAKPTTWLVPNNGAAPAWITGGRDTLAVRITQHPIAAALCELSGDLLVSTSANPQGLPPARTAEEARAYFSGLIDGFTPGEVGAAANPSEIRDIVSGEVIRAG